MTLSEINDLSAQAAFLLLFGMAASAIGYLIGKSHGHEAGELAGSIEERRDSTVRIIKAKRDGFHSGRIHGFVQAMTILSPTKEDGPIPTRPRKPGINNSAAPAMQGAPISQPSNNTRVAPCESKAN